MATGCVFPGRDFASSATLSGVEVAWRTPGKFPDFAVGNKALTVRRPGYKASVADGGQGIGQELA